MGTTKQFCNVCHIEHDKHCADNHIIKVYNTAGKERIHTRRSITDNHGEEYVFLTVLPGWPYVLEVLNQSGTKLRMSKHRFPIIVTTKRF